MRKEISFVWYLFNAHAVTRKFFFKKSHFIWKKTLTKMETISDETQKDLERIQSTGSHDDSVIKILKKRTLVIQK